MADLYTRITEADPALQQRLAEVLEVRAADPQQQAMLQSYLVVIPFLPHARVLEVGCGTGAIARFAARWPGVAEVVGVDPSPVFLETGRTLSAGYPTLTLQSGDALDLPFGEASFDMVPHDEPGHRRT